MEKITSKNNTIIKDTKKLFTSSRDRYEQNLMVLEGARLCFDVLNSALRVDTVLFTPQLQSKYPDEISTLCSKASRAYEISSDVCSKLSETKNAQGIFVVVEMPKPNEFLGEKLIALDRVQDPSNIGSIIRSAEALGINSIIVYDSCDTYNPKAIRASMGSVLRMNIVQAEDLSLTIKSLKSDGYSVYSTVPDSNAKKINEIDFKGKALCIIGNETNGIEDNIKQISDELITIPMLGRAESLNAGIASAITMWEMLK